MEFESPSTIGAEFVVLAVLLAVASAVLRDNGGDTLFVTTAANGGACGEGLLHNFDSFLCGVCFSSFGDDERVSVVHVNIFIFDIAILVASDVTSCGSCSERTV